MFEHGEVTKAIYIPIHDDDVYEANETFEVQLFNPTDGAEIGRTRRSIVTILNDDGEFWILDTFLVQCTWNVYNI